MTRAALALPLLALLVATGVAAQDARPASGGAVGLAVGTPAQPYRDFDDEVRALPFFAYENRHISVAGPRIDYKLPLGGPLSWRLRARYGFDGYEAGDSPVLAGMAEREGSAWLGGALRWESPGGTELGAELLADASGHSKGRQFGLQLEHGLSFGAFRVTPRLGATWVDRRFVDYYYGVTPAEATTGRPAYGGDATVNVELGVRVAYGFAQRHLVFVDARSVRFGSAIKDSPLVDGGTASGFAVGWLYRF